MLLSGDLNGLLWAIVYVWLFKGAKFKKKHHNKKQRTQDLQFRRVQKFLPEPSSRLNARRLSQNPITAEPRTALLTLLRVARTPEPDCLHEDELDPSHSPPHSPSHSLTGSDLSPRPLIHAADAERRPSKTASEWASKRLQEEEIHNRTRDDSRIKFPNFFFSLPPSPSGDRPSISRRSRCFLNPGVASG